MDNKKRYVNEVKNVLIMSPIRNSLADNNSIPFRDLISKNLNRIMEEIDIITKKDELSLKIAIVGEVKSGKSSLLNALLSKEVSEVDILEVTSSIIEVVYDENMYKKTFDGITKIGLNLDFLKKINLVDTPGLKSITVKNEQRTLNYIQNADLILFVIDATHIGQEDVYEALEVISSYKKPIVGIINKSDLLQDEKEKVIDYIRDEYAIYIDDFFMISSYLEYQERISKSAQVGSTDIVISTYTDLKKNFIELNKYIENICENYEQIKIESINSSVEGIVHKDIVNHHEYSKSIIVLIDELKKHERTLENKLDYINAKMNFEIADWVNRIFLSEEIDNIKESIEETNIYINENYINDVISKKKIELDKLFFNEWSECLEEVNKEIDENIKKHIGNINYINNLVSTPDFKIDYDKTNLNDMLATLGTGAILGATSATIISAYAAGLGASSASLTIGTALMTYCPPLLIAGTLTGGVGKIIYDKVKIDKKNKEIFEDIDNFSEDLKCKILESLKEGYSKSSRDIVNTTIEVYKNSKGVNISRYIMEDLLEKIEKYIENLKQYVNNN